MMKLPLVVTAASVTALMGAYASAAPIGSEMTYLATIAITGLATGTGTGTGTGAFDDSGTLTIAMDTSTNIPALLASATVTTSTVYNGSITGTTWTSDGTTSVTTIACTGSLIICGQLAIGTTPGTTTVFSTDINSGGSYSTTAVNGPVTLNLSNTLTPIAVPPPSGPGDPAAIPTMPLYGLGLTIAALFGTAIRQLRTADQKK